MLCIFYKTTFLFLTFFTTIFTVFGQNHVSVGLYYPMNDPFISFENSFGEFTASKKLFHETYTPDLQIGILFKCYGKFQPQVRLSSKLEANHYVPKGPYFTKEAPTTLDEAYTGINSYYYLTTFNNAALMARHATLGALVHYHFTDNISVGTGLWWMFNYGRFNYYTEHTEYKWDQDRYVRNDIYYNNPSQGNVIQNYATDYIEMASIMLPLEARYAINLKSGDKLGFSFQSNLGPKLLNFWLGTYYEF